MHVAIKHIHILVSLCDRASSHYIFCVIMPAYPHAILELNFKRRKYTLMIYIGHKEKPSESQVSKLKAFYDGREEMSGQPERCRILSHVSCPTLKPDRQ